MAEIRTEPRVRAVRDTVPLTPAGTEPPVDAVTYWDLLTELPADDDPLGALIPRPAAAYGEPR